MKTNKIKLFVIAVFVFSILAILIFQSTAGLTRVKADGDISADYKKNCMGCHTATASKFYDPAKPDADHIQTILKGKKGEKPPYMPAFETKGVTPEQAKAYADYMHKLRTENTPAANTANTAVNANTKPANTNVNASANTVSNVPANTVVKAAPKADASEETIAAYKKNCMACHTATASKFFDSAKADAVLEDIVVKGKKGEKPPYMPAFETKLTAEQTKALVAYMKQLKTPAN